MHSDDDPGPFAVATQDEEPRQPALVWLALLVLALLLGVVSPDTGLPRAVGALLFLSTLLGWWEADRRAYGLAPTGGEANLLIYMVWLMIPVHLWLTRGLVRGTVVLVLLVAAGLVLVCGGAVVLAVLEA